MPSAKFWSQQSCDQIFIKILLLYSKITINFCPVFCIYKYLCARLWRRQHYVTIIVIDDITVSIAAAIVLRNLTTPPNADEDGRVDSSLSQLVPPRRSTRQTTGSAAANVGQRSPSKDGETQPDEYSVASSNRRLSSPSGEESGIRESSADNWRSPHPARVAERTTLKRQKTSSTTM